MANISSTSLLLTWAPASDAVTPASELRYTVYASTTYLSTETEWLESTQAKKLLSPTANLAALSVVDLTPATTYYFAVLVENGANASSLYAVASAITEAPGLVVSETQTISLTQTQTAEIPSTPITLTATFTQTIPVTAISTQTTTLSVTATSTITQTTTQTQTVSNVICNTALCNPGYGINPNCTCAQCITNYYSPGAYTACTPCPGGMHSAAGDSFCTCDGGLQFDPGSRGCLLGE